MTNAIDPTALADAICPRCGAVGTLGIRWRLRGMWFPLAWSIRGLSPVACARRWPFLECSAPGCGYFNPGRVAPLTD